jgi:hypothetical protein
MILLRRFVEIYDSIVEVAPWRHCSQIGIALKPMAP